MEPIPSGKRASTNTENGVTLLDDNLESNGDTCNKADDVNGEKSADSSGSLTNGTDEKVNSTRSLLESLDLEVPSSYEVQPGLKYNCSGDVIYQQQFNILLIFS